MIKEIISKAVIRAGASGKRQMQVAGWESAAVPNHKLGHCGVSPATRLFGTQVKLHGELYEHGESVGWHPDVLDVGNKLAMRFDIRRATTEAAQKNEAEQVVARAVAARSRPLVEVTPGQRCLLLPEMAEGQEAPCRAGALHGTGSNRRTSR